MIARSRDSWWLAVIGPPGYPVLLIGRVGVPVTHPAWQQAG